MASCKDDLFQHTLLRSLERLDKAGLEIKEKQHEALSSVVRNKNDTICVLPTGYGKSLIYQLLPFMFDFYSPFEGNDLSCSPLSFVLVLSQLNATK
jgi:bloom syndrome protein